MELDFIDNINEYGENVVRLYNFDKYEAIQFRDLIAIPVSHQDPSSSKPHENKTFRLSFGFKCGFLQRIKMTSSLRCKFSKRIDRSSENCLGTKVAFD